MAKDALTVIKNELYIIINVKNFHSMLVLIIIKLMYLINMKIILLKRCYTLYSFVLQCLTQFYLFF